MQSAKIRPPRLPARDVSIIENILFVVPPLAAEFIVLSDEGLLACYLAPHRHAIAALAAVTAEMAINRTDEERARLSADEEYVLQTALRFLASVSGDMAAVDTIRAAAADVIRAAAVLIASETAPANSEAAAVPAAAETPVKSASCWTCCAGSITNMDETMMRCRRFTR